jgi:hypothetical protein
MKRQLVLMAVMPSAIAACSPGPPDNPVIGLIAVVLIAVSAVTVIGGVAWLLGHPGQPRLATLMHGLARSLGITIVVLVVGVGLLYLGLQLRLPAEKNLGYWPIDERTLGVVVIDAPNLMCGIARVEESRDAVRIHAQCDHPLISLGSPAMAQQYVFRVILEAPLGDRTVQDGSGEPPVECQDPAPDCIVFP